MHEAIPDFMFNRVTDISVDFLHKNNIKAVGIDLDNTTVVDSTLRPLPGAKKWVAELKEAGFPVVIVSNAYTARVWLIAKIFGLPFFSFSKKPSPVNVIKAAEFAKTDISEFVMIGDLLFADVIAANRAGAVSVKVEPYKPEILFFRKFRRKRRAEAEFVKEHYDEFPVIGGNTDEH